MNFTDVLRMKGTLVIHVRQGDHGPILRTILKRNTITFDASEVVRQLVAQRATDYAPAELKLASMRFGRSAITPSRYDTNLHDEEPTIRKQLTDAKKIDGLVGELLLQATLTTTEGNGNTLQEAGLFVAGAGAWDANIGGSLKSFARQIHGAIAKTSAISLDYNWTLQFTA
jgi:hypothetical protein